MSKKKNEVPQTQPWAGDAAPVADETPVETVEQGADAEETEASEEPADESDAEETPADSAEEAPVSAAIKPADKKAKKVPAANIDGAKEGLLQEGDHLPHEVIHLTYQGMTVKEAIAHYNAKQK